MINKIGTSQVALCADESRVQFTVCAETYKFSRETAFGDLVKIEERSPDETSEDVHLCKHIKDILATDEEYVGSILNGEIIQVVRSAGAPHDKGASLILNKKGGIRSKSMMGFSLYIRIMEKN